MTEVRPSSAGDFDEWIRLAKEVEPLFGPMVDDPDFHAGLRQAISDNNAFCAAREGGVSGQRLTGGVVVSREANEILWLAVEARSRGQGVGRALLAEAVSHLDQSRPMTVTTFDASVEEGLPARRIYQACGFRDDRPAGRNPAGIPIVVMVCSNSGS